MNEAINVSQNSSESDRYWSTDLPGLNARQAEKLVEFARGEFGVEGDTVNPHNWLTLHLGRDTVELLKNAVESIGDDDIAGSMKEEFEAWLEETKGA